MNTFYKKKSKENKGLIYLVHMPSKRINFLLFPHNIHFHKGFHLITFCVPGRVIRGETRSHPPPQLDKKGRRKLYPKQTPPQDN